MDEVRAPGKKQTSILIDDQDYADLERIARSKRSYVSQVVREFVVAGIERERRASSLLDADHEAAAAAGGSR